MSAKAKEQELAPTEGNGSQVIGFLQVIDKAASNPDVDAEKLHRMLDAQERILDRNARMAYTSDLATMSGELPVITEGGEIKHSGKIISRYARWDEDINPAIKPILARYGFHLSFRTGRAEDGSQAITAVLSHREGHSEETTIYLPADDSGAKNKVQAVGSTTSYGKRYTAGALLNLTTGGMDDDGQTAGGPEKVSDEQAKEIEALMAEVNANETKFLEYMKVTKVSDIPARDYDDAIAALNKKRSRQ